MTTEQPTRYIPVSKWKDFHMWPPIGGLRSLIFNHVEKNFTKCFKKVGKRVFIDEKAFFQWMGSNGGQD